MTAWIAALSLAYMVGAIPTAYLLVRCTKRIDVRTVGSGNVGATNATRAMGLGGGIAVFLLDAAKGLVAACVIAPWWFPSATLSQRLACGLAAVLGHDFPVFLKFRGGKGVSTTIGVLLGTMPLVTSLCLAIGVGGFLLTRMVSLGALTASSALPVVQWLLHRSPVEIAFGVLFAGLILVRHRANIQRLIQGKEHRF